MTDPRVQEFWNRRASDADTTDAEVTHRDVWQRWLEIETIRHYLRSGDRLLDVGCGTGYTTLLLAPHVNEAIGIDVSETMLERARRATGDCANTRFEAGDVLALDTDRLGYFDVVLSSRCLINLSSWEEQRRAILNVARMLKPGGRFVFLEGSADGRNRLNAARAAAGVEPMPPVWHNVDFEEEALLSFLDPLFVVDDRRHFGLYDFVARIVHPMLVAPEPPQYHARINEIAAHLALQHQAFPDLSRVIFLVLSRKAEHRP